MATTAALPASSMGKIQRWMAAKKAAGQTVQPWELEAAYAAEMNSLAGQQTQNRALTSTEKGVTLQEARDAETARMNEINAQLARDALTANTENNKAALDLRRLEVEGSLANQGASLALQEEQVAIQRMAAEGQISAEAARLALAAQQAKDAKEQQDLANKFAEKVQQDSLDAQKRMEDRQAEIDKWNKDVEAVGSPANLSKVQQEQFAAAQAAQDADRKLAASGSTKAAVGQVVTTAGLVVGTKWLSSPSKVPVPAETVTQVGGPVEPATETGNWFTNMFKSKAKGPLEGTTEQVSGPATGAGTENLSNPGLYDVPPSGTFGEGPTYGPTVGPQTSTGESFTNTIASRGNPWDVTGASEVSDATVNSILGSPEVGAMDTPWLGETASAIPEVGSYGAQALAADAGSYLGTGNELLSSGIYPAVEEGFGAGAYALPEAGSYAATAAAAEAAPASTVAGMSPASGLGAIASYIAAPEIAMSYLGGTNKPYEERTQSEKTFSAPVASGMFPGAVFMPENSTAGKLFKEASRLERQVMAPIDWVFGQGMLK